MCPECGLRARLAHSQDEVPDPEGKCKHRKNPATCPVLSPAVAVIRQMLKQSERPH